MSGKTSGLSEVKAGGSSSVDRTSQNLVEEQLAAEPRDAGNDSDAVIPPPDGVTPLLALTIFGFPQAKKLMQRSYTVVSDPVAIAVPQSVAPEPVAYVEPYEPPAPANIVEPPQPQPPPEPESYTV